MLKSDSKALLGLCLWRSWMCPHTSGASLVSKNEDLRDIGKLSPDYNDLGPIVALQIEKNH